MSNKRVVETYMEGFNTSDHTKILSCLAKDIIWDVQGAFQYRGERQF